jgi:hypothetical protein
MAPLCLNLRRRALRSAATGSYDEFGLEDHISWRVISIGSRFEQQFYGGRSDRMAGLKVPDMMASTPAELIARSNRLGAGPHITNYAGGNTSAKGTDTHPAMHGVVNAPHVGHLHPEADIALGTAKDGEKLTKKTFGSRVVGGRGAVWGFSSASTKASRHRSGR